MSHPFNFGHYHFLVGFLNRKCVYRFKTLNSLALVNFLDFVKNAFLVDYFHKLVLSLQISSMREMIKHMSPDNVGKVVHVCIVNIFVTFDSNRAPGC
jgi:hypothetical protein